MKLNQLYEHSNEELIKIAKDVGETLFGKSHSGLVFSDKVKTITKGEFDSLSDDGGNVDTYQYSFFPSTKKGIDSSDSPLTKKLMDKDGIWYLAGADGVLVIKPGSKESPKLDTDRFGKWKKLTLEKYPKAKIGKQDKWNRFFAFVGSEMVAQYSIDGHNNNPNVGLVHPDIKIGPW